jgi:hypothetical protein
MKTIFFSASNYKVLALECMTVRITDSASIVRDYTTLALDICNHNFVSQLIKEHASLYSSNITKIEIFTYTGKRFKTIIL